MSLKNDKVSCYSGFTYAQRPRSFEWENVRHVVKSVVAEWQLPDGKQFRVLTEKDTAFDLCYAVQAETWTIKQI